MKIQEYNKSIAKPPKQATLCFLVKDGEVLLAMKKRGFGVDKYNGVGGKKNENETIEEAAVREAKEEIGVTIKSLQKVATLDFFFNENKDWDQQVIVFLVNDWKGVPKESEEMAPKWFKYLDIPYSRMWKDDLYWLPHILKGKKLTGEFTFGGNEEIIDYKIKIL